MKSFTHRLHTGTALGTWCSFASFDCTELMAHLPFDFLILDMQHSEITQADFPALLGAFREGGPTAVVRATQNDYHLINWLFDQGAPAVMVPMINSAEEARRAVAAAKYPPLGRRSFGPHRCARYTFTAAEYMPQADELSTLIVQVEDARAAREIGEILAVPGIDAVFLGPNDLAFSLLQPGQSLTNRGPSGGDASSQWSNFARSDEVAELCRSALARCREAGIPFGITSGSMAEARDWFARGASFVTVGADFLFLKAGAEAAMAE